MAAEIPTRAIANPISNFRLLDETLRRMWASDQERAQQEGVTLAIEVLREYGRPTQNLHT